MTLAFAMTEPHLTAPPAGPMRTCIATGEEGAPERMIRFVVGPEGEVVPDLARQLPGRGMWVRAERAALERAVEKKLFSRAARAPVKASARTRRTGSSGCCSRGPWPISAGHAAQAVRLRAS